MTSRRILRLLVLALLLAAGASHAHTDAATAAGFSAGFLHPLGGLDHLLAIVAVGVWGATSGRPLIWALPVAFPVLMVIGGAMGIAGFPLPFVEAGVAASVVALGLAVLAMWRAPVWVAVALVGCFGVCHGYAHGAELPQFASPIAYSAAFFTATAMLHLAGIGIGSLQRLRFGETALRISGALIAACGVWILAAGIGA